MSQITAADGDEAARHHRNANDEVQRGARQSQRRPWTRAIELDFALNIRTRSPRPPTRETAEGRIAAFIDPAAKFGALIEVRCESAPVAKSELFIQLANDLAKQVALKSAKTSDELLAQPFVGDAKANGGRFCVAEVVGLMRENVKVARMDRFSSGIMASYIHHDGSVGVLLQVEGDKGDDTVLRRDICMHIAAKAPLAGRREDIPADKVAKELEIAKAQLESDPKNKNKAAADHGEDHRRQDQDVLQR